MKLPDIFLSAGSLRTAFEKGLESRLKGKTMGAFILVLTDAMFDKNIFSLLKNQLQNNFEQLSNMPE